MGKLQLTQYHTKSLHHSWEENSNLLVLGSQNETLLKNKYFLKYWMANNLCTFLCTSSCLLHRLFL